MKHTAQQLAGDQLRSFVERIERLHEARDSLSDDIRDIYVELRGNNFDVKAVKEIIRIRRKDAGEVAEMNAILETYMIALGMVIGASDNHEQNNNTDTTDAPYQLERHN